jgi:hypothetical protein
LTTAQRNRSARTASRHARRVSESSCASPCGDVVLVILPEANPSPASGRRRFSCGAPVVHDDGPEIPAAERRNPRTLADVAGAHKDAMPSGWICPNRARRHRRMKNIRHDCSQVRVFVVNISRLVPVGARGTGLLPAWVDTQIQPLPHTWAGRAGAHARRKHARSRKPAGIFHHVAGMRPACIASCAP